MRVVRHPHHEILAVPVLNRLAQRILPWPLLARQGLSDAEIDGLVAERTQAKKQRNFARADQIRNELAEKGILIEDSKDGVRWKRK